MTYALRPREGNSLVNMHAAKKVRLRCRDTGKLLHTSGAGTTNGTDYAWLGFRHQADTLAARAAARGEEWPYRMERRSAVDGEGVRGPE